MEEINVFLERLRDYVDKKITASIAKNNTINNSIDTTLNGYRSMGLHQLLKYQTTPSDSSYTIGSTEDPVVGP